MKVRHVFHLNVVNSEVKLSHFSMNLGQSETVMIEAGRDARVPTMATQHDLQVEIKADVAVRLNRLAVAGEWFETPFADRVFGGSLKHGVT